MAIPNADPTLHNADLAPTAPAQRTWSARDFAALWIGMAACVPTYMLAGGLVDVGMSWWQAVLAVALGNVIVLAPMILTADAGTRYGIPFPVLARASSITELRELGVFWIADDSSRGQARDVFVTRLHVRYDGERFPEDLRFRETADRSNFQGRYVMRHAWKGSPSSARRRASTSPTCPTATSARRRPWRGSPAGISRTSAQMDDIPDLGDEPDRPWWQRIWPPARGPGR